MASGWRVGILVCPDNDIDEVMRIKT